MNTKCERCTGERGAHFAFCFVAQAWERFMGPNYPWSAPAEPTWPLPPEPDWDWLAEVDDRAALRADIKEAMENAGAGPTITDEQREADPPNPEGVMEDFLVGAGAVQSDAEWMPHGAESVRTDLPDDYYDRATESSGGRDSSADPFDQFQINVVTPSVPLRDDDPVHIDEPEKPKRVVDHTGIDRWHKQQRELREDAAVQFVYDTMNLVPGGRIPFNEVYGRYSDWRREHDRIPMDKQNLRRLLTEIGLDIEPGRMPGGRRHGKAPLLVHGVVLKSDEPEMPEPKPDTPVKVKATRVKHPVIGERPGKEMPKEWRDLIEPLITEQGWAYYPRNNSGRGKPRVISPTGKTVSLASTPSDVRAVLNAKATLKQNGAVL